MKRPLHLDYPADYELDVRVRGNGPDNALQLKLADAKNENVWWVNRASFSPPEAWTQIAQPQATDRFRLGSDRRSHAAQQRVDRVHGLCRRGRTRRSLLRRPRLSRTGDVAGGAAQAAGVGVVRNTRGSGGRTRSTAMRTLSGGAHPAPKQSITVDLGIEREFGGLVLRWHDDAFASNYEVALSDDAKTWRTVRRVTAGNGGADPLYLPESEARYVRLSLHGRGGGYALDEIELKDLAFGASANAFFSTLAKSAPRGWYPRGFYDEQTYWTIVGVDGGHETGLFSEDGALEVSRGGFSIAPIVADAERTRFRRGPTRRSRTRSRTAICRFRASAGARRISR